MREFVQITDVAENENYSRCMFPVVTECLAFNNSVWSSNRKKRSTTNHSRVTIWHHTITETAVTLRRTAKSIMATDVCGVRCYRDHAKVELRIVSHEIVSIPTGVVTQKYRSRCSHCSSWCEHGVSTVTKCT